MAFYDFLIDYQFCILQKQTSTFGHFITVQSVMSHFFNSLHVRDTKTLFFGFISSHEFLISYHIPIYIIFTSNVFIMAFTTFTQRAATTGRSNRFSFNFSR